jgi:hypothetical protein
MIRASKGIDKREEIRLISSSIISRYKIMSRKSRGSPRGASHYYKSVKDKSLIQYKTTWYILVAFAVVNQRNVEGLKVRRQAGDFSRQ